MMTALTIHCADCGTPIHWIDCPTGGWWAHEVHPADDHDARPGLPPADAEQLHVVDEIEHPAFYQAATHPAGNLGDALGGDQ